MFLYILTFIFGTIIGSFLNVLIYRVPKHEDFIFEHSHCMSCGTALKWYDLIPIVSYVMLKGKCRCCKAAVSKQYPIIEGLCGLLWVSITMKYGFGPLGLIYCLLTSALLALSVIDFRTMEIPVGFNYFILALGIIVAFNDRLNLAIHVIGFFAISVPLFALYLVSKGAAIGGGDIKLMATAGLLLGWQNIILAFFAGCILGAVIHLLRMKFFNAGRTLAMGPYLAAGIFLASLFGEELIRFYIGLF